ncbi:MAG: hypothetical protein CFE21_17200 [Bacteroidetes bacterium B1(2017)]|nr:MAG: hypothetical protein CFE21_17200 [Bacteroidetes bacterium B1(2017)]
MIELDYTLQENDFLEFQLYFFKSEGKFKSILLKTWMVFMMFVGVFIGFSIWKNLFFEAAVVAVMSIIVSFIHPWRMRRTYKKILKKDCKVFESRLNTPFHLLVDENQFHIKSILGDTNLNRNQLAKIVETGTHFFVKFKLEAVIIPKSGLSQIEQLRADLKQVALTNQIEYKEDLNWKW